MVEEQLFLAKIRDMDRICSLRDIPKRTGFLSASELSAFYAMEPELSSDHFVFGGYGDAERAMVIFPASYSDRDALKKESLSVIKAEPVSAHFAEELSHRDFLGALMGLGIERDCIGDILVNGAEAFIFCEASMTEMILRELTEVRHTKISCAAADAGEISLSQNFREISVNIASERADALIAAVYRLTRSKASALITGEKVTADGRLLLDPSKKIPCGAKLSVRGFGKFIFDGITAKSRKDRLFAAVRIYV